MPREPLFDKGRYPYAFTLPILLLSLIGTLPATAQTTVTYHYQYASNRLMGISVSLTEGVIVEHDALGREVKRFKPDATTDTDSDGLTDREEVFEHGTTHNDDDTDGDGLLDGDEILVHGTSAVNHDTDGDGFNDKYEIDNGRNPNVHEERELFKIIVPMINFSM